VLNRYGRGTVIYLPMPFFLDFGSSKSPHLKEVFRALLQDTLGISRRVRITAPTTTRTVLTRDTSGWLLHVIPLTQELDSPYLESAGSCSRLDALLNPGWPVQRIYNCLSKEQISFDQEENWIRFRLTEIHEHQIYRVEREKEK